MGGLGEVVQIDESPLKGKKKYHRGRILLSDQFTENIISDDNSDSNFDKENVAIEQNEIINEELKAYDSWIFGLCWKKDRILERRFFVVER